MVYDPHEQTLTTERLFLRLFQRSDAETVAELCNNENIYQNTMTLPYPYTIDDALIWIGRHHDNFEAEKSYEFAITDKKSGQLYGAIALSHQKKHQHGELSYWIGEPYWSNGYATEAAQAIILFAFNEKAYHKVFARHFASNPTSGKVMQKLGMKQEGHLVDHVKKDDRYESLIYYGIINPAFRTS
ncbi:GNAT family N-acetyltransferase [Shouchella lonarensis]|uniref:Protein N-acetyltransferase, RimJ/RimL family n=1 Tax=Shouchella lonarensis TaxID=1464122 RepID=A0A1G6MPA0_9BACI|nr:GNAT family N-acetyltransferase [Shouchella lonarensis]SDC57301.1 Protein N-acetyltransferase, RimJ/RimL family [Shouchella lonarensis]